MGPLATVPVRAQSAPGATPPKIQVDTTPLARSTGAINSFAPIVDRVGPSIVTVFTSKEVKDQPNSMDNPTLRHFFGIPNNPDGDEGEGGKVEGLGSGVIVSADGLILTNNHVAEAGDEIMVRIGDHGHEYKAKVVGNDPSSDLALLRIDAKNLPVITFADSDQAKVGDIVLAVGSPFGLTNTVTSGIISALGRGGIGITSYEDFIQTDASINPGNSGGALVNLNGELIGINSAILSKDGGNIGIGFAIPVNMVKAVMDQLITYGEVKRGVVGIKLRDVTPEAAESLQLVNARGVEIAEVAPGSAADHAGIKVGDVVVSMSGVPLESAAQLRNGLALLRVGQSVDLRLLRAGAERSVTLTINPPGTLSRP
jgi:serine protease Do/serine protease DegQ